ncbi:MAG: Na+/H+ antiporter subunit E [Elusimicrobiota bacterium]
MKKFSLFALCFIFWLLLVWRVDWQNTVVGLVISIFVSALFGNIEKSGEKTRPIYFVLFFVRVVWLWIKASVIEVYLALSPQEIKAEEIEIEINNNNEKSKAFLIMALNLSPNITVIDDREDKILINSHGRNKEDIVKDVEKLEKLIEKIVSSQ